MHAGALKALEFDRVVDMVRRFAVTPLGMARLAGLAPQTDPCQVALELAATTEAARCLADEAQLPLEAPDDLEQILSAVAIEGRALEPEPLLGLAQFLSSVAQTQATIGRLPRETFPILNGLAGRISQFRIEIERVRQAIDTSGELVDQASPKLGVIRDRLRKQRHRLRGTMESYLRGRDTSRYLQEQIVTDRNGRYVLVVRSEHRTAIPGIVHGSSASGASLFLEPLSTVELNNDIVALQEQEHEEIRRILLELTDTFRRRAVELHRTLEAATDLDVVQAKARFAQVVEGIEPTLAPDGRLELRAARHPLLIAAVAGRLSEDTDADRPGTTGRLTQPVPIDVLLIPPVTTLVVTGPNTGGKTVALKTAGLLALMAQAGLHIPAASGSHVPVFGSVFADIGDEQSITGNLSTFSGHVANIVMMDRALRLPALVLLDEIGAGTDPVEGGALGTAVIDHFRRREALVIATTHYDALKSYASTTAGVTCAAFGFDPETFAPTYSLQYGSPGRSLALEIASRLGLAPSIIDAAQEHRSSGENQLAEHLAKVEHDLRSLEHERRVAEQARDRMTAAEAEVRRREALLDEREEVLRQRQRSGIESRVRGARREIDAIVDEFKRQSAELPRGATARGSGSPVLVPSGKRSAARAAARAALDEVANRVLEGSTGTSSGDQTGDGPGPRPAVGDHVTVGNMGFEGVVRAVTDSEAELDARGKRLRVPLHDLRVVRHTAPSASQVSVNVQLLPRDGSSSELNVIGCTVDEALSRTETFLDDALLAELDTVRVIHGHGTGRLRRAIADLLRGHQLVERFHVAPPEEGGSGVTVVELKA